MGKDAITLVSNDEIIKTLAGNLHKDICRLQSAIIKKSKHEIVSYIESASERSCELVARLNESTMLS